MVKTVSELEEFENIFCVNCGRQTKTTKMKTELAPQIKAVDQKTGFAYKTIKERLPMILTKTSEFFTKQRKDLINLPNCISEPTETQHEELITDAKFVASEIIKLRKEIESNESVKLFEKIDLDDSHRYFNSDVDLWNAYLNENKLPDGCLAKWFDSAWLLVECYMYRRIKDIMLRTKHLKNFDPFIDQKINATRVSSQYMCIVAQHLIDVEKGFKGSTNYTHPSERTEFGLFTLISLWSNKVDLSLSCADSDKITSHKLTTDLRDSLESLDENILCNNSSDLWFRVQKIKEMARSKLGKDPEQRGQPILIDLVADNSGYEIFSDLCLINFLVLMFCGPEITPVVKFRLHLKKMPWFVSDALRSDIEWLLSFMKSSENSALQNLAAKWRSLFDSNLIEIYEDDFWTLPHDYSLMKGAAEHLYDKLSGSSLIIFKGDLNYRKLTGDRRWHLLTPFKVALRGFEPAPLVALRTAKAEVVVGIEDVKEFTRINNNELPRDWMTSGDYGLIQYLDV